MSTNFYGVTLEPYPGTTLQEAKDGAIRFCLQHEGGFEEVCFVFNQKTYRVNHILPVPEKFLVEEVEKDEPGN